MTKSLISSICLTLLLVGCAPPESTGEDAGASCAPLGGACGASACCGGAVCEASSGTCVDPTDRDGGVTTCAVSGQSCASDTCCTGLTCGAASTCEAPTLDAGVVIDTDAGPPGPTLPTDPSGYTVFTPSADSRVIYVSSSMGDDANDGLDPSTPVATIDKGVSLLRDGYPDHLLFRRGDTFSGGFGRWRLSGRSVTEPMVIGAYGDDADPRPLFQTGGSAAFGTNGAGGAPASMDYLAFVSLYFHAHTRDPSVSGFSTAGSAGISWIRGTRGLLIEDCVFRHYGNGANIQGGDGQPQTNIRFFRTLILDSYNDSAHSQGTFINGPTDITFEECIFDHNGWNESVPEAEPTIFNHNLYFQNGSDETQRLVRSIVMRASSHGIQMRSGGRAEGNLFVRNPLGLLIGGGTNPNPGGVTGWAIDNVFLEGNDILPREGHDGSIRRGAAIDLENIHSIEVRGNIAAHCIGGQCASIEVVDPGELVGSGGTSVYADNLVYDWRAGGRIEESPGPFVDPDRSLASYNASLGGPGTFEAFVQEVRAQSKTNWRPAYTAAAVNAYIREGFASP